MAEVLPHKNKNELRTSEKMRSRVSTLFSSSSSSNRNINNEEFGIGNDIFSSSSKRFSVSTLSTSSSCSFQFNSNNTRNTLPGSNIRKSSSESSVVYQIVNKNYDKNDGIAYDNANVVQKKKTKSQTNLFKIRKKEKDRNSYCGDCEFDSTDDSDGSVKKSKRMSGNFSTRLFKKSKYDVQKSTSEEDLRKVHLNNFNKNSNNNNSNNNNNNNNN
eukprot:Pgem_evm1s1268